MFAEMKRVGFDSPIKALTFEFRNMLVTEQVFDMTCRVTDIRTRTFDVEIIGRSTTEKPHDIYVCQAHADHAVAQRKAFDRNSRPSCVKKLRIIARPLLKRCLGGDLGRSCTRGGLRLISGQEIRIDPAQPFQIHLAGSHHVAEGKFERRQMLSRIRGLVPEDGPHRGILKAIGRRPARALEFREACCDIAAACVDGFCERDRILIGHARARADGGMHGLQRVTDQHHLAGIPAL